MICLCKRCNGDVLIREAAAQRHARVYGSSGREPTANALAQMTLLRSAGAPGPRDLNENYSVPDDFLEAHSNDPAATLLELPALADLQPDLFAGSTVDLLTFSVWLSHLREKFSIPRAFIDALLFGLKQIHANSPNSFPECVSAVETAMKAYGVVVFIYDVCPNDCVIYRKEFADLTCCPVCAADRYSKCRDGTFSRTGLKHVWHLPLGSQLQTKFR